MSKIIKLTEGFKDSCVKEFIEAINAAKLSDGKLSFTKTFDRKDNERATIYFTSKAWLKMITLVNEFNQEVAWHGVTKRTGKDDEHKFIITDILVYPQKVTGATVNTDQVEYQNWLMGLDDNVFNNLRMQGHSHVNMQTTPSSVDLAHQEKILEQLEDDMFYIFMIWNKRYEHTIKIYDLKNNILFEDKDIDVRGADEEDSIFKFLSDAKKIVVDSRPATSYYSPKYDYHYKGYSYGGSKKDEPLKPTSNNKKNTQISTSKPITRVDREEASIEDFLYDPGYGIDGYY